MVSKFYRCRYSHHEKPPVDYFKGYKIIEYHMKISGWLCICEFVDPDYWPKG